MNGTAFLQRKEKSEGSIQQTLWNAVPRSMWGSAWYIIDAQRTKRKSVRRKKSCYGHKR